MSTMGDFFKRFFPLSDNDTGLSDPVDSPIVPTDQDGAEEIRERSNDKYANMLDNYVHSFVPSISNTKDLINTYRQLSEIQEVDQGIQEIADQAVVNSKDHNSVSLDLDSTEFSESIKEKINNEMQKILRLYDFRRRGSDMFRRWYIDSRSHYFLLIDPENKKDGIKEIRYMDPRSMKRIREYQTSIVNGQKIINGYRDFYEYTPVDLDSNKWAGTVGVTFDQAKRRVLIPAEHVAFAHSGKFDYNGNMIGWLHQVIRPANQLKLIEDHIVIYRISRAPERRVFYIDIGTTPRSRAIEYVNSIKNTMRKKVSYDAVTGKVKSDNNSHSVMEDIWLPRKANRNTEVQTLGGGQNLGELTDLDYFKQEVYEAIKLPKSRYDDQGGMLGSRETEISRDELRFHKFVGKLRDDFSPILKHSLKIQLISKNVLTEDEWNDNSEDLRIVYNEDSYFQELVDAEILSQRLSLMRDLEPHIGKYFSHNYVMRNVFAMSSEEIDEMRKEIEEERKDKFWQTEDEDSGQRGF